MMVDHARSYVGTAFEHQARVPGSKLDCVGVIVCAAKAEGIDIVDFFTYGHEGDPTELSRRLLEFCDEVDDYQPDDILAFWVVERGRPCHVAIYEGAGYFIHAYSRRSGDGKVRRDSLYDNDGYWSRRVHKAYRVKREKRRVA